MNAPYPANARRHARQDFNTAVHGLRAFAALMVFGCHMLDSFHTYLFPHSELLDIVMPFVKRFGTFGVELFFAISGYVIMASIGRYSTKEFFLRRLVRIYPVFAFFTVGFFILNTLTHLYPDKLSLAALGLNLLFLDIYFGTPALSPNAWSLTFEANFYLMAGLACWLLRTRRSLMLAPLAAAAAAFMVAFPIAAYFAIGCLVYFLRDRQPVVLSRGAHLLVVPLWFACAAVIERDPVVVDRLAVTANVLLFAVTAAFFFLASAQASVFGRLGATRVLGFVGTISYSFYLTHPYSYLPMRMLFQKFHLGDVNIGVAALVYFPAMTAVAIGASYVVHRLFEVAPYRAAFRESLFKEPTVEFTKVVTSPSHVM